MKDLSQNLNVETLAIDNAGTSSYSSYKSLEVVRDQIITGSVSWKFLLTVPVSVAHFMNTLVAANLHGLAQPSSSDL